MDEEKAVSQPFSRELLIWCEAANGYTVYWPLSG